MSEHQLMSPEKSGAPSPGGGLTIMEQSTHEVHEIRKNAYEYYLWYIDLYESGGLE